MRLRLIPVCYGRHIVLPLEIPFMTGTDLLDRHTQILLEEHRIHNMPAVESSLRHHIVIMIEIMHIHVMM